jgi:hypothetical protein
MLLPSTRAMTALARAKGLAAPSGGFDTVGDTRLLEILQALLQQPLGWHLPLASGIFQIMIVILPTGRVKLCDYTPRIEVQRGGG